MNFQQNLYKQYFLILQYTFLYQKEKVLYFILFLTIFFANITYIYKYTTITNKFKSITKFYFFIIN